MGVLPSSTEPTSTQPISMSVDELIDSATKNQDPAEAPKRNVGGRPKGKRDTKPRKPRGAAEGADVAVQTEERADLKPILGPGIRMPFAAVAQKTGCKKLELSDEETKTLVDSLDEVLKTYLPNLGKEESALTVFVAGCVSLGYMKFLIYKEWQADQEKKNQGQGS